MKKAFITGITGQDGSYLSELLLAKGYEVHGLKRRASSFNTQRIDHLYEDVEKPNRHFFLHYGDLTDSSSLTALLRDIQPDEVYNLGAQSHVQVSFDSPEYTANVDGVGTLRLLEAIRLLGLADKTRFYQASTSELFGKVQQVPQTELTPFYPRSPYACAKLYAYWICVNYREAYGMYACNGILFNHESPRRGETFVTRKITRGLARALLGLTPFISLGNMDSRRDWGHARDYVYMQWLMLQQPEPEDYVIATGRQFSIREFLQKTALSLGIELDFSGRGLEETAIVKAVDYDLLHSRYGLNRHQCHLRPGDTVVKVNPRYFRPTEVDSLLGDPTKAIEKLGWKPATSLETMIDDMLAEDILNAKKDWIIKDAGYAVPDVNE